MLAPVLNPILSSSHPKMVYLAPKANPKKCLIAEKGLQEIAFFEKNLAPYTTFHVGGIAQIMLKPRTEQEIIQCMSLCQEWEVVPKILGGGSNILITQKEIPVVISLRNFNQVYCENEYVYAQAGAFLSRAIQASIQNGLQGLELFSGIPGTIGGAVIGNSGSKWEEKLVAVGDFIEQVTVFSQENNVETLPKSCLHFGYRETNLKDVVVLKAVFRLQTASIQELEKRSIFIKNQKKETQPLHFHSAGCIFKNPKEKAAWKLICSAGLSGKKVGNAMVSTQHANFILNLGNAEAGDVLELIEIIRTQVKNTSGVDLNLEVKIW